MILFESTSTLQKEIVDCRALQFFFSFDHLSKDQVLDLREKCIKLLQYLFGDNFFAEYCYKGRRSFNQNLLQLIYADKHICSFSAYGILKSSVVKDTKSFREYLNEMKYGKNGRSYTSCSIDYKTCFEDIFHNISSEDEVKACILKLFSVPNVHKKGYWNDYDFIVDFLSSNHESTPNLYYGKFHLRIAKAAICNNVNGYADFLSKELIKLSEIYKNIGGYVALSPCVNGMSSYMHYFCENKQFQHLDKDKQHLRNEWVPYTYIQAIEWFNLLTPMQTLRVGKLNDLQKHNVVIEKTKHEALIVRSTQNIIETDITEITNIKNCLYKGLFPGQRTIELSYVVDKSHFFSGSKPRGQWELVPISERELQIIDNNIIYKIEQ